MQNIKPLAKTIALRWRFLYNTNLNVPALCGRDDSSIAHEPRFSANGPKITSYEHAPTKEGALHNGYISVIKHLLEVIESLKKKGDNDND